MSFGILTNTPSTHTLPDVMHSKADTTTKMKSASESYEATFLNTMFSQMFEGIPTDGLGHGGQAEETWRGMLINEYSKSVAKAGGIGLAKHIYSDLVRVQERSTQ
jgi:Rod binding domain-containing protein